MMARLAWLVAAAALLALLVWAAWPSPTEVEIATVQRERFEDTVQEDGQTRVRERYVVAAPLAGTLLRIALKTGDEVAAGATIASILPNRAPLLDPRARQQAEQKLGSAEAALARSSAVLTRLQGVADQARVDAERSRTLAARGAIPNTRLENDELALRNALREAEAARAAQHAAEHEMELARAELFLDSDERRDGMTWPVRSPASGRVLRVLQRSESPVSLGTPLAEIGDPGDLEVVADVLTTDAVRIHTGDPVQIEGWGGARPLDGTVRVVEPGAFTKVSALGVDEQRTNVIVDLTSPFADRRSLGDGYRVDVRIVVAAIDQALVVPAGALFRDRQGWAVFAVTNGQAERRSIELTLRNDAAAAVAQGLSVGDQVILYPADTVTDGARVRPR